jgi:NitT/TauT family transport system permease protein
MIGSGGVPVAARARPTWPLFALGALAIPVGALATSGQFGDVLGHLPQASVDLSQSFGRMLAAYLLALGFSLVYGYFAAAHRMGERILIPLLDILQSVPILGFFPVAIVFFVEVAGQGNWLGPNLASVFLIFTSMAWNMVFGVYESLRSLPSDLKEAADSFAVRGWQRVRRVLLPATVNRLVYNSVLSWTAGWYFLVAAEFISTSISSHPVALQGIGSYLLSAASSGDINALWAGLIVLVALIAALDVLVWRPLGRWAENFRYDQVPSGEGEVVLGSNRRAPLRRAAGYVYRGVVVGVTRLSNPLVGLAISATPMRLRSSRPAYGRAARTVGLGALLVLAWLLLIFLSVGAYDVFSGPIMPNVRSQIATLPLALVASFGRLILAYLLSLAIAVPLAIFLVQRPKVYRLGLPLVEVFASVPATALFPLFIFALVAFIGPDRGGFQAASILMLTTGMLWYLFFNILSGLRAIPPDLKEAARSFGLSRREYYRRLVLPAIFPALITGSITAFGGGWNALIIAEFLQYGPQSFSVLGVGQLIDIGNQEMGGYPLMAAALFTMVATVVAVNELLWKPLYRRAIDKYRYD